MERNAESPTGGGAATLKPGELEEEIELAMRKEIGRIGGISPHVSTTFRADVSALFLAAKRRGIRAESLIIAMKRAWRAIPGTRAFARPAEMDSLLGEMVAMALDEFYDPSSISVNRAD